MNLTTKGECPICGYEMEFNWESQDLPHFGEAMMIAGVCSCGFRHSDTLLLSQKEPARYTLAVESSEDLNARVIKSCSGTIRLPEIGVDVEPGPASEAYISNVEGVLDRVEGIVDFATRGAREVGDFEKTARGEEILAIIEALRCGKADITLIIEDPLGNSAIESEKAVRSPLTDEEVASLRTGMVVIDI